MKMTVPDLINIWITARTRGIIVVSFVDCSCACCFFWCCRAGSWALTFPIIPNWFQHPSFGLLQPYHFYFELKIIKEINNINFLNIYYSMIHQGQLPIYIYTHMYMYMLPNNGL